MDIGANIGVFTVFAAALSPKGKVYAFEPVSKTFATLSKNIAALRSLGRAEAYRCALGDKTGETTMRASISATTGSLIEDSPFFSRQDTFDFDITERVPTMRIDDFTEKEGLKKLDFIKIDTEGYERFVLDGARETIRRFKPAIAMSAYHNPDDKTVLPALVKEICPEYVVELSAGVEEDFICYVP